MKDYIGKAVSDIVNERANQISLWGDQNNKSNETWLVIITEEVGEAAKAILENDNPQLLREVVQIAAVATAWIEKFYYEAQEVTHG